MLKIIKLIWESFLFASNSFLVNKLRTSLSLLGITIGIFAIISVFTIVDSLETNIRESVSSLGSDVVYIDKWPWTEEMGQEYQWWQYANRPVPTLQEYELIKEKSRLAGNVGFTTSTRTTVQYKDNKIEKMGIQGVTEEFVSIHDIEIASGRYFIDSEIRTGRNYGVIGSTLASNLFGNLNPVDKNITIKGFKIKIIGVLRPEGKNDFGQSADEIVILPVNFIRNMINIKSESMNPNIWVKAGINASNEELLDELTMLMRSIRRLKPNAVNNFALNRTSMLDKQLQAVFTTLNIAGWFIGIFSLLVGGFGIANIMFVGVKERTHIIGIQKALGAKRYFILLQFIFEAILLAIAGGIVGLLLVFSGTIIVNYLSDFTISLTTENILTGIFISSIIGLIAGFAPAFTASRLSPVNAINTNF